jgi:hypothetical protein
LGENVLVRVIIKITIGAGVASGVRLMKAEIVTGRFLSGDAGAGIQERGVRLLVIAGI